MKPTVLVVGAGASVEYGLKDGWGLLKAVEAATHFVGGNFNRQTISMLEAIQHYVRTETANDLDTHVRFEALGSSFSSQISAFDSVDEALHHWSAEPEIVLLGKAAIAMMILEYERESWLATADFNDQRIETEGWLWPLFKLIIEHTERSNFADALKNLTIINFNYDRVIEHFLYNVFQYRMKIPSHVAAEMICRDGFILRPYGTVSPLPWQKPAGNAFGVGAPEHYFSLTKNLRTYTETVERTDTDDQIADAMAKAHTIAILGFGFAPANLALLKPRGNPFANRHALATCFEIPIENHAALRSSVKRALRLNSIPDLNDLTARQFFDDLNLTLKHAIWSD